MNNSKRKFFNHAGLRLSYLDNELEAGDRPVVLLHGFTASAKINWLESGWLAALTRAGRRVLAIDARGHGESDKPYDRDYYGADIMIADSIALLAQLGFDKADYAGFSMGARMSTFAAIQRPDLVGKLMIGGLGIGLKTGIGNPEPIAEALRAEHLGAIKSRRARRFRRIAERCGNDLEAMASCILSSRRPITDELLAQIEAETLIIVGDEDITGGDPHALQPFIKNSKAIAVPECNHFNALTNPQFRAAGITFLTDSPSASS